MLGLLAGIVIDWSDVIAVGWRAMMTYRQGEEPREGNLPLKSLAGVHFSLSKKWGLALEVATPHLHARDILKCISLPLHFKTI